MPWGLVATVGAANIVDWDSREVVEPIRRVVACRPLDCGNRDRVGAFHTPDTDIRRVVVVEDRDIRADTVGP